MGAAISFLKKNKKKKDLRNRRKPQDKNHYGNSGFCLCCALPVLIGNTFLKKEFCVNRIWLFNYEKEDTMSIFFHCCMLFYIVFVVAEIRTVLLESNPRHAEPITIWNETSQHPDEGSDKNILRQKPLAFLL